MSHVAVKAEASSEQQEVVVSHVMCLLLSLWGRQAEGHSGTTNSDTVTHIELSGGTDLAPPAPRQP